MVVTQDREPPRVVAERPTATGERLARRQHRRPDHEPAWLAPRDQVGVPTVAQLPALERLGRDQPGLIEDGEHGHEPDQPDRLGHDEVARVRARTQRVGDRMERAELILGTPQIDGKKVEPTQRQDERRGREHRPACRPARQARQAECREPEQRDHGNHAVPPEVRDPERRIPRPDGESGKRDPGDWCGPQPERYGHAEHRGGQPEPAQARQMCALACGRLREHGEWQQPVEPMPADPRAGCAVQRSLGEHAVRERRAVGPRQQTGAQCHDRAAHQARATIRETRQYECRDRPLGPRQRQQAKRDAGAPPARMDLRAGDHHAREQELHLESRRGERAEQRPQRVGQPERDCAGPRGVARELLHRGVERPRAEQQRGPLRPRLGCGPECDTQSAPQRPERRREAHDPLARVEDEPVPVREVPRVAERDVGVLAGPRLSEQHEDARRHEQRDDRPGGRGARRCCRARFHRRSRGAERWRCASAHGVTAACGATVVLRVSDATSGFTRCMT